VTIGDSGNDAEMLRMTAFSFAMGNASDAIKAIARHRTDDNNHQGALNVIQAVLDGAPRSSDFPGRSRRSGLFPSRFPALLSALCSASSF
jgi:hypothetical protein